MKRPAADSHELSLTQRFFTTLLFPFADSIEELATAMGLDPAAVVKTVERTAAAGKAAGAIHAMRVDEPHAGLP